LALKLLAGFPQALKRRYQVVVLADAGFGCNAFFTGLGRLQFDALVGVIAVPLNMRYTLDRLDKGFSLLFVPYQINNRYIKHLCRAKQ
jgi:hypothetical protein